MAFNHTCGLFRWQCAKCSIRQVFCLLFARRSNLYPEKCTYHRPQKCSERTDKCYDIGCFPVICRQPISEKTEDYQAENDDY